MGRRTLAGLALLASLAALCGSVSVLHGMAEVFPASAIPEGDLEEGLAAIARLLGLGISYWLIASTGIYMLSLLLDLPKAARAVEWSTLPALRRLVNFAVARSVVAALTVPMPVAEVVEPGYIPVPAGDATTTTIAPVSPPATTIPSTTTSVPTLNERPPTSPKTAEEPQPPTGEVTVVVQAGDNMWRLAEARLATAWGRDPMEGEVAPYWARVVDANRDRIRSGDPDLIYPGEELLLPAL